MPRWSRSPGVPRDVVATLPLAPGERVLAASPDLQGHWQVGTERSLHLTVDGGWLSLPWQRVERATWDRDTERLVVIEVADFGQPQPRHVVALDEPGRLLELIHERVTASVVLARHVPVSGSRGLKVVGRRAPGGDGAIEWSCWLDEGLEPADPEVAAAVEAGLASARAELGEPPSR